MSWMDSSSGLSYTTCWMGDYVTAVIQYRLSCFINPRHNQLWYWHCLPSPSYFAYFLILWHFPLSFLSSPFQQDLHFPVLEGGWNIQNLFISSAVWRHRVPPGQFVTMWNARRCPWGWPLVIALPDTRREKKRETERNRGRDRSRGRMNLTKALKQIRPTQQSQGSMQPGCQHLSLVKGSLPDNVTLITESPDSDFLSFSV